MKERPIIFNAEMVRAILDGRKTQTRRPVKPQPKWKYSGYDHGHWAWGDDEGSTPQATKLPGRWSYLGRFRDGYHRPVFGPIDCPFGQPGDRLWVRETWARMEGDRPDLNRTIYRASLDEVVTQGIRWRPSIHMPRWASRITLEITGVRVERVQECSEADAKAEGAPLERCGCTQSHFAGFRTLWDSIYPPEKYGIDPWVWVIEFARVL